MQPPTTRRRPSRFLRPVAVALVAVAMGLAGAAAPAPADAESPAVTDVAG